VEPTVPLEKDFSEPFAYFRHALAGGI